MVGFSEVENLEFKWGRKKGIGGRKKDVQVYESFLYDGVEYWFYDCVYMFRDGVSEPDIGKIIKIWENADKSKKVKILWFLQPFDITNFLGPVEFEENELFLASGEGKGLANINPLVVDKLGFLFEVVRVSSSKQLQKINNLSGSDRWKVQGYMQFKGQQKSPAL